MNSYSKKILKYFNKYSNDDHPLTLSDVYQKFSFDEETIDNSLSWLEEHKFIKSFMTSTDDEIQPLITVYSSTTKGLEYFKFKFHIFCKASVLKMLKYLLLDIITPLLIAYFTAIITTNNTIRDNECCNKTNANSQDETNNLSN